MPQFAHLIESTLATNLSSAQVDPIGFCMAHIFPVGIDLGTTNSAAAYVTQAGRTAILRNDFGDALTPSCVFFDDDGTIVGRDAKKALSFARDRVVANAKRDLGDTVTTDHVLGRGMPPEAIEAIVLRSLGHDVQRELDGAQVVITVPAFFDERRRGLTLAAGEMADLNVLTLVNEPTAAALAFGEQLGYLSSDGHPRERMNLMVYDLGGGTFDVTVLQLANGAIRTLATDGDFKLGGIDWDRRLLDYVAQKFEDRFRMDFRDDIELTTKVLQACEAAKQTLSVRRKVGIPVDVHGRHMDVTVTRDAFEQLTEDLVERTAMTARHALEAAELNWPEIDRVLLVGGSTRMPMIPRRIIEMAGRPPDEAVNPDEAVARGAAIFAAATMQQRGLGRTALRLSVVDVNSHSLGVAGIDQATRRLCNKILIPRNTPLPARVTYKFVTKEDDQQSVAIKVLEGESEVIEGCSSLGKAVLRDLPPDLPKGHPIDVVYHCREDGCLEVTAAVTETDSAITVQFDREHSMSTADMQRWRHAVVAGKAFEDLEPLLERLGQYPSHMESVADEGPLHRPSKRESAFAEPEPEPARRTSAPPTHRNNQPVCQSDSERVPVASQPLQAIRPLQDGRSARDRRALSAVWIFLGAIVGAMLLILLIRVILK